MPIARLAGMQQASSAAPMSSTGPVAKTSKPCQDDSKLMMGKTLEIPSPAKTKILPNRVCEISQVHVSEPFSGAHHTTAR